MKIILTTVACFFCTCVLSQDSLWQQSPDFTVSGFIDVFNAYDFNKPTGNRQPFFYNHNRHNETNLNLGLIKVGATHEKYRANLAMQAGTYPTDNYAAETGLMKHVFEANVGLALNKTGKLWLDAGVFSSHIGFESAISIDNWTLTRSLLAENSPYYLAGAKLTVLPSDSWEIAALVINGWQRIQRLPGNSLPSFGTQVKYSRSDKFVFNWSTFIGTDSPDISRKMRYFNNLYAQMQLAERWGLILGFDLGFQQQRKGGLSYKHWFSPVIISQYRLSAHWRAALRVEYFQDRGDNIVTDATTIDFETSGASLNLDYLPIENLACRLEGRILYSAYPIFEATNKFVRSNVFLVASISLRFGDHQR